MNGYKLTRIVYFIFISFLIGGSIGYNDWSAIIIFAMLMMATFGLLVKVTMDLEEEEK